MCAVDSTIEIRSLRVQIMRLHPNVKRHESHGRRPFAIGMGGVAPTREGAGSRFGPPPPHVLPELLQRLMIGSALPSGSPQAYPLVRALPRRSTPAACGAAIEVPLMVVVPPPFLVERMLAPGAA